MRKDACFYLGKVIGKFSFKGELLIKTDSDELESFKKIKKFFIEQHNLLIPFFIEKCLIHKSSLLRVKLEDIDDETKANELLKKNVYLPKELLPKLKGNKFYFHDVINFKIIDKKIGEVGFITGFNSQTVQSLMEVRTKSKDILIPVHDHIIMKVDKKNKFIIVDLPEGLMELF